MHHLNIDWLGMAQRAGIWRSVAPGTRRYLLGLSFNDTIDADRIGTDRGRLVNQKFIAIPSTGRISFHPSHRPYARALRAMQRHDLLAEPNPWSFEEYLRDQYTVAERQKLLGYSRYWSEGGDPLVRQASSAGWLKPALDAAGTGAGTTRDAGRVVRAVLAHDGVIRVEDLPRTLGGAVPAARLTAAVNAALNNLWVLATMRPDDMLPLLVVWPPTVNRLNRKPAVAPRPQVPVREAGLAFLMEDAAALLVATSAEPLRLRGNDFALFAKAAQRVEATLAPLPEPMAVVADFTAEVRVSATIAYMQSLDFVKVVGRAGRDLRVEVTAAGREWLARPAVERIRPLLDFVRIVATDQDRSGQLAPSGSIRLLAHDRPSPDFFDVDPDLDLDLPDDEYDGPDPHLDASDGGDRLSLFFRDIHPVALRTALESAVAAAYDDCGDHFISLHGFVRYRAEHRNPLTAQRDGYGYIGGVSLSRLTEEDAEQLWADMLAGVLVNRLAPLGGAVLGHIDTIGAGFRLTGAGRYILGLDDRFDPANVPGLAPADAALAQILVQPNFEIVFLTPAPAAEAELGRFAARVGSGIGTLFRITRDSVLAAGAAGLSAENALQTLQQLSTQPVPQNVAREVAGWFAACRRATADTAYLLRFPDAETATRALAATGRDVVRLAPTILEVTNPGARTAIARKLRKDGIFVEQKDDQIRERRVDDGVAADGRPR